MNFSSFVAGWSSSVARWAHNPEVVGSNPAPATKVQCPPQLRLRGTLAFLGSRDCGLAGLRDCGIGVLKEHRRIPHKKLWRSTSAEAPALCVSKRAVSLPFSWCPLSRLYPQLLGSTFQARR